MSRQDKAVEALALLNGVFDDLAERLGVGDQPKEPHVLADAVEALKASVKTLRAELLAIEILTTARCDVASLKLMVRSRAKAALEATKAVAT